MREKTSRWILIYLRLLRSQLQQQNKAKYFSDPLHCHPIGSYSSDDPQQKTDSLTAEVNWT